MGNAVEKPAVMKGCSFMQRYWNGNFSCDKLLLKCSISILKIESFPRFVCWGFFSCFTLCLCSTGTFCKVGWIPQGWFPGQVKCKGSSLPDKNYFISWQLDCF